MNKLIDRYADLLRIEITLDMVKWWTFLIFLGSTLHSECVVAQLVSLKGRVVDDQTGDPLVGCTVAVGDIGTYTNLEGWFDINLSATPDHLTISYVGYQTRQYDLPNMDSDAPLIIGLKGTENLLGEVTVTTGKFEQIIGESTASIAIIKPDMLEQTNTTSLDEVLGKVPGVSMIDGQVNIRGGSGFSYGAGSRVLLLVDDIPAYQADAGFPNWDDLPVENLAQMEIVKGAASALYGSAAMNGIINVRTAYAREQPETKASIFYGQAMPPSDRSKKWWTTAPHEAGISLSDARRVGKWDFVHAGYFLDRDSEQKDGYYQYGRLNSKIRFRASDKIELGIRASLNRGVNQNFFYWKNSESGAYTGDSSTYSTGNYIRYAIDPYLKVINDRGDRHEVKARVFDVNNRNNDNRSNRSTLWYGEYQYLRRMTAIAATLTVGLVGTRTDVNAVLYGDTLLQSSNLAAFAQFEKKFFDRLILNTGLRYENNTTKGPILDGPNGIEYGRLEESKPVFRFGANYHLAEYTYLRASWGEGYRYPTLAEKYITTSFGATKISPNYYLNSETGWSAEFGVRQGFRLGGFGGILDLAYYWSNYYDMMEFVFTGLIDGFQSQNVGDTRISGVDVSISGKGKALGIPIQILAGYTFIEPRFQDFTEKAASNSTASYNILKYRAKHLGKFDIQTSREGFNAGFSMQYSSNVEAIDKVFYLFIPGIEKFRDQHKGYLLTDFRISYPLVKSLRMTALVRNAFNVEYSVRPGLLEPPRSWSFRMDYSW